MAFEQYEDIELVKLVQAGSDKAFSELVKRYESSVRACLRVRLSNIHEAEDLAQEAFIISHEKLEQFDGTSSFGAWLRGIAINLLRNHQRKKKALAVGGHAELDELINARIEQNFTEQNESERVSQLKICLAKLDDKMRTLLTEHFTLGFSLTELCKKYGAGHSTMTMRMYRLRQKLKQCVEDQGKS